MNVNDCRVRDGFDFKFLAFNFKKRNQPFEFTISGGILAKDSGAPTKRYFFFVFGCEGAVGSNR